jgi:hypothetical protein
MKKAVWFSRHTPSPAQIEDARNMGYEITRISEGMEMGALNINDEETAQAVVTQLLALCDEACARAVFGVFPTPILHQARKTGVEYFASWNVSRSVEGGKPTFEHYRWLEVA